MQIHVESDVIERFGEVRIGILSGNIQSARSDLDSGIDELRAESLENFLARSLDAHTLMSHPHIVEWRLTYERFGTKARTHRPTHEALARRVLREGVWPKRINPIVDVYLTNQLSHLLPHGGYDCKTLNGSIHLAESPGKEDFFPLGGGSEITECGEIIYRDASRVLTRRWNFRDCDTTKITSSTHHFILMLESAGNMISDDRLESATIDLRERYQRLWIGNFNSRMVCFTPENLSFDLDEICIHS